MLKKTMIMLMMMMMLTMQRNLKVKSLSKRQVEKAVYISARILAVFSWKILNVCIAMALSFCIHMPGLALLIACT
jgi:uncharacterized membrane protein